ncbi:MAG: hypothetical protein CMI32_08125 [Opitutales bacterium]|nr:hypothetical protein [Opitutales bacterium]
MKMRSYILLSAIALIGSPLLAQDAPGTPIDLPGTPIPGTPLPGTPVDPLAPPAKDGNATAPAIPAKVANELRAVVRTNIHAWGTGNLNLLRSTTHSESPLVETSDLMARYIFARYKLKYTVTKVNTLEVDDDEAEVEVHQTTEKIDGPSFRNNRAVVVHTLKKENGKWKMWGSEVKLLQFLE